MLRVLVMVSALAAFFSAVVFVGGDAVGAWDEPRIAPDTADRPSRSKEKRDRTPDRSKRADVRERRAAAAQVRWAAKVDALCLRASREVAALRRPTTAAQATAYLREVVRLNSRLNDDFAALRAPRALRKDAQRVLALLRRDERLVQALIAASSAGDATRATRLAASLQETAGLESALLIALGAKRCDAGLSPYSRATA
jgi:hypothetical protein